MQTLQREMAVGHDDAVDITMVGAGPVGLYGMYSAGLHGLTARIFDRLPVEGGQLAALYPEKQIYDVAGFPRVTAAQLVERLSRQADSFGHDYHLAEELTGLVRDPDRDGWWVETPRGRYATRRVVVTAGIGQFSPRRLPVPALDAAEGHGVHYVVGPLKNFEGRRVLVVGGGNSAADWALNVRDRAERVAVVHRRGDLQCHRESARQILRPGAFDLYWHQELVGVRMEENRVAAARLHDVNTGADHWVPTDDIIVAIGLVSDLGPLAHLGLELQGGEVPVKSTGESGLPGVYAAGDIATYPGKVKLIATGFGEVATAVYHAAASLR